MLRILAWVALLLPLGCNSEGGDSAEADPCERTPALSYDNFGHSLMDQQCAGCHSSLMPEGQRGGAPLGVDLDTYAGVLQWVERVEVRATGPEPTMPPGGGLSDEESAHLVEWLDCAVFPEARALGYIQ